MFTEYCICPMVRIIGMLKNGWLLAVALLFIASCTQRQDPDQFDEEEYAQAVENLVSVATSVESYFQESQSVDDMVARMDEIKAIEGVVDAYATKTCFYIDIEGWGVIGYPFDRDFDAVPADFDPAILKEITSMVPVRSGDEDAPIIVNGDYKACVMNAQHKERQWTRPVADAVIEMFKKCGIEADLYDDPKRGFFKKDIFDYNLIFIIGHGCFDEVKGLHWLETRDEFVVTEDLNKGYWKELWVDTVTPDQTMLYRNQETYDGESGLSFRLYVSDQFISKSSHSFSDDGKAVLFMVPCQTLMCNPTKLYEDAHTYHHESNDRRVRLIDDSMAQVFFDKGAGLYIGYDESSSELAQFGGMHFFARLLSGYSFEQALNDLPTPENDMALLYHQTDYDPNPTYVFENMRDYNDDGTVVIREWDVARHILTDNGFDMSAYVVSPAMTSNLSEGMDGYVFSAIASYSPDVALHFEDYWDITYDTPFSFVNDNRPQYGFTISKGDIPTLGDSYPATVSRNAETHRVFFQLERGLDKFSPNTEYHVWPYIAYDNTYNYGNEIVFTTGDAVPSMPVPEAVDMGLSVKWASFNVGASKPEEHGHYFAWGETSPDKVKYDWKSYQLSEGEYGDELTRYCNMTQYGYEGYTDSRTVLEPGDDAARANLSGKWRMPTRTEFEELLNPAKCTVKWEPQSGVAGLKVTSKSTGKTVFFPAAGSKSGPAVDDSYIVGAGTLGRYWSSSLNTEGPYNAYYLLFDKDGGNVFNYYRYYGYPVRAVLAE